MYRELVMANSWFRDYSDTKNEKDMSQIIGVRVLQYEIGSGNMIFRGVSYERKNSGDGIRISFTYGVITTKESTEYICGCFTPIFKGMCNNNNAHIVPLCNSWDKEDTEFNDAYEKDSKIYYGFGDNPIELSIPVERAKDYDGHDLFDLARKQYAAHKIFKVCDKTTRDCAIVSK